MNRRQLLKAAVGSALATLVTDSSAKTLKQCLATPAQTEGPFYPIHQQSDKDLDLTLIAGHSKAASGEVVIIQGQLLDKNCQPISNAKVEIWQANKWGRYQHKRDPNKAPLDPHFQGWGIVTTDKNGHFRFKTIFPGVYPATPGWHRPPHIHYKIYANGRAPLTTQMYFEGQALNDKDRILQSLSKKEQASVIAKKQAPTKNAALPDVYLFKPVLA